MIRAHLATFPPRRSLLRNVVMSMCGQVDRLYVCLNGFQDPPHELDEFPNLEVLIPENDLMDAGKFAFPVSPNDIIFTIDDDIAYPTDYVERTLRFAEKIGLNDNSIGYQANAYVWKNQVASLGWRNYMFRKKNSNIFNVDILGTGTACFLGRNCPSLEEVEPCAGFVDFRFSRHQTQSGVKMWSLPREEGYLENILPQELADTSLFLRVNRKAPAAMRVEIKKLLSERSPGSGEKWKKTPLNS